MSYRSLRPLSTAAAVLACTAPLSQASADTAGIDLVDEVLVTARSIEDTLPLELSRYGHDVEFVSAERIAAAGYVDASTALQYEVPGLYVAPRSGPFSYVDVSLQGSRTGDVLWLIDGVRINNRIFNDTSPDTLPAGMIERIEVLKGGESLFYGTQGVAGAINIVTRSFSDDPGGNVSVSYDNHGGYQASGYGGAAVRDHKFVVYASRNESDGFEQFDRYEASATDRERGYEVSNVGLKYGYDFSDRLRLDAFYHHTDALLDNTSAARTKRSYNDRDEDIASARLAYEASDELQLIVKAYLHDWDTTYGNIQNDPQTGAEVVVYRPGTYWGFRDYGASALARFAPGGGAEYHFGYDYQNYKARDDVFPIAGETETVHAFFGQIRTAGNAFEDLNLAAGLRYNRGSGGKDATVWNVSGRYDISDALYVEGVVATAFLLPSAEQLYYIGEPGSDDYVGNPDLLPEESNNLNLSIGGGIPLGEGAVGWQLTGFARDIDNLIDIGYDDPLYPHGRYENVEGETTVRGVEASLAAPLGEAFRFRTSYTYTESRDEGSDLQRQRTPLRFATAQLTFAPRQARYETSVTMSWTGDVFQNLGAFGRRNYGDYTVVNLSGRVFLDDAERHRLGLSVQNAFDEEYGSRFRLTDLDDGSGSFAAMYLGAPRTVAVSYTYDF